MKISQEKLQKYQTLVGEQQDSSAKSLESREKSDHEYFIKCLNENKNFTIVKFHDGS